MEVKFNPFQPKNAAPRWTCEYCENVNPDTKPHDPSECLNCGAPKKFNLAQEPVEIETAFDPPCSNSESFPAIHQKITALNKKKSSLSNNSIFDSPGSVPIKTVDFESFRKKILNIPNIIKNQ